MGDALKQKMMGAVAWNTVEKAGQQVLQFLAGIVFARLLAPEDFGVMGIIMIVVALSLVLIESGYGHALIRKATITQDDYTSVYYFNLFTACVLYLLLFVTAPLIAGFFQKIHLVALIRVTSLVVIVNALYLIPYAHLGRALNFKAISRINLIAVAVGAASGVVAAFQNFGVWSLVVQQATFHVLRGVLIMLEVRWKPTGRFRFGIIRGLSGFSLNLLITSLSNVIFNNLFLIILGRSYSKAEAGQFAQGNRLSQTFSYNFQAIFAGIAFALFSQIQLDTPRLARIMGEMIRRAALVTIPIVSVLIAVAQPLIILLWTEKFLPAAFYFQLMSLASLLVPFYIININALNARGKSGVTMAIEFIKKALIILGIILLYKQGIAYMLMAFVAASLLAFPISVWFIRRELQLPFRVQLANILPGILIGIAVGIPAAAINLLQLPIIATLSLQIGGSLLLYALIIRLLFRNYFDQFISYIGKYIPKRFHKSP